MDSSNFEFAFNSSNFSDRLLIIEIVAGPSESLHGSEECTTVDDWTRRRKSIRDEIKASKAAELPMYNSEQFLEYNQPDTVGVMESNNHYGQEESMAEEPSSGEPSLQGIESLSGLDHDRVLRRNSIFISSAILAAKSPFFYKLFSNGMQESDQRHAILRINASEEAALMELLGFMYSGKLSNTSPAMLLDVLMAADKFQVASCMAYCSHLLRSLAMTTESALLYLELPSLVSMSSTVQLLADDAKVFFAEKYKDLSNPEVMDLSLAGIEAILYSDSLQVASEDSVYDFAVKWARAQYPDMHERKQILWPLLHRVVRFPFMSCRKLRKILTCTELDYESTSRVVIAALAFKCERPQFRHDRDLEEASNRMFVERSYKYRPVKVVEFEVPHKQCIAYLNLTRVECANLYPVGRVYTQAFHLGGQGFFLSCHCNVDQTTGIHCLGLFLGMQEKGLFGSTVEYEFAARTSPLGEFVVKHSGSYTFTGGKAVGYRNLFSTPWMSFLAEDSCYFINNVLHLRAQLTIKEPEVQLQQPQLLQQQQQLVQQQQEGYFAMQVGPR